MQHQANQDTHTSGPAALVERAHKNPPNLTDAAEMLWVVLANVSGSDWSKQSQEWQDAAARWRDYYFDSRPTLASASPAPVQATLAQDIICRCGYWMLPSTHTGTRQLFVCAHCGHWIQVGATQDAATPDAAWWTEGRRAAHRSGTRLTLDTETR